MPLPLISVAMVVAQDPFNRGLQVVLRTSGQSFPYTVQMLHYGPFDALRVKQPPMPSVGSWGLVSFPYGDARNGVWLGTIPPNQVDAITGTVSGTGPAPVTDSYIDYESQWSGYWRMIDAYGQFGASFPDGSYFVVGSGYTLPTVYRHWLNGQDRESIPYISSDRIAPGSIPALPYSLTMVVSGLVQLTTALLAASGNISATGNLSAGNGATGSLAGADGQVVTFVNGIAINIA